MKTAAAITLIHFNVITFIWWSINPLQNSINPEIYKITLILLKIYLSDIENVPGDDTRINNNIDQCKIYGGRPKLGWKLGLYCKVLFSLFPREVWVWRGVSGGDDIKLIFISWWTNWNIFRNTSHRTLTCITIPRLSGLGSTEMTPTWPRVGRRRASFR